MSRGMSELDQLAAPDLRNRLNQRTRFSDMPDPGLDLQRSMHPVRRAVVVASALALFAIAGAFAWSAFRPTDVSPAAGGPAPPFARYLFSSGEGQGVLEVQRNPPSICYSTSSATASNIPITLVHRGPVDEVVTLDAHGQNDYCDRSISAAYVASLIADPNQYVIQWTPNPSQPEATSSLVPLGSAPSVVVSPNPSAPPEGTTLGSQHLPARATQAAVAYLNSMACNAGSLDRITARGTTTVAHLAEVLPTMAGVSGSASGQGLPSETPIYAAIVRGHCQSGGQPYVQGYVLFDDETTLFWRVWNKGLEPHLESPFGPRANAGLSI